MSNLKPALIAVMLFAALYSCATRTGEVALRSSGDIIVNGPGFDGSVHEGTKVLYTLKNVLENQKYTLRTEISIKSDGSSTSPDGTLTVNIYSSADAFRTDPTSPVTSAVALPYPNSNIYEVNFSAHASGDYVVVISGVNSILNVQFFYNLRLMSADPSMITGQLISIPPASSETVTTYMVSQTNALNPGYLHIYNGGEVLSTVTFTSISLTSTATTTIANPQVFLYLDSSLTVSSLMLSSIPTTTEFIVTAFNAGVPTTITEQPNADVISNVTFTSGLGGGPFIVLKGFVSAVTYTLSIGP